jgi:hypothetical protein
MRRKGCEGLILAVRPPGACKPARRCSKQLERQRHYAEVGPTRESDGAAFERPDRTRRVAAFLASVALRDRAARPERQRG